MDTNVNITPSVEIPDFFTSGDAIGSIGVLLGQVMDREQYLDRMHSVAQSSGDGIGETYFEKAGRHEYDRIFALKDLLSVFPAVSLEGATIQLTQALNELDLLFDDIPEEVETYAIKRRGRVIERLLFSAIGVLEKQTGSPPSTLVTGNFSAGHTNMWLDVEDRIQAVKESLEALK